MKRLIRLLRWRGVQLGVFVMFAGPGVAWAQTNTFPSTGNVGIGTTTPTAELEISGAATADLYAGIGANVVSGPAMNYGYSGATFGRGSGFFNVRPDASATAPNPSLRFMTVNIERMIVTSAGLVGIGTSSPAAKLHVAGDAQVDGNLAAKYQDVAEWVTAPIAVPPGVVLIVDPQARNQVVPASGAYDTRVAGVVSSRPGLLLGEAGESKVKVAHSGRVKVKVDASYGRIAAGDLLVTSPTSGYAMRSVPIELGGTLIHRPGTVLGKALEPLETGQDEILVLLTLQ